MIGLPQDRPRSPNLVLQHRYHWTSPPQHQCGRRRKKGDLKRAVKQPGEQLFLPKQSGPTRTALVQILPWWQPTRAWLQTSLYWPSTDFEATIVVSLHHILHGGQSPGEWPHSATPVEPSCEEAQDQSLRLVQASPPGSFELAWRKSQAWSLARQKGWWAKGVAKTGAPAHMDPGILQLDPCPWW